MHNDWRRVILADYWEFNVSEQGWRYHMSDIMAAIGRVQLSRFAGFDMRGSHWQNTIFWVIQSRPNKNSSTDYTKVVLIFSIKLQNVRSQCYKSEILFKNKVQFGFHYMANHKLDYFKHYNKSELKITEDYCNTTITLPLHPNMTIRDCDFICELIESVLVA